MARDRTATVLPTSDLSRVDTDLLRQELARGLSLVADNLTRLALIWAELERRGEDLADLRRGLARTLPLIAAGRLDAHAVVAFAGRPAVLRALEGLPLTEQRRLADGGTLEVIDPGNPERVQSLTLAELPHVALRVVLADGQVRSPAQQRLAFRPRRPRPAEDETQRRYQPRYDRGSGTIGVGKMRVDLADLLQVLAAAHGPDYPLPEQRDAYLEVKTRLAPDENERLLAACRRAELPPWEMIRKALRAFGLI